VLVVEAFGVNDNEVLARAWCSHWGLSAIVADVERTWWVLHRWPYMTEYWQHSSMACAIREGYGACINVVILVEPLNQEDEAWLVEGSTSKMQGQHVWTKFYDNKEIWRD
jgi:hypothetical protein